VSLSRFLLKLLGWKVHVDVPDYPKSIICVAPHTSNLDFVLCELAIRSIGRRAGFLMKSEWFFWPLGPIFRAIGGIAVHRQSGQSLTPVLVKKFAETERINLAITPEGTRSRTTHWHTGFLRVAAQANVPVTLAVIDYGNRCIRMDHVFEPTGSIDQDMLRIKQYYSQVRAMRPDKFTTDPE
jgi:1-acyl-sn-glycerol-3-phosphate acyltransferase